MFIAIDARELTGAPTGVGRYLSSLVTAWGKLPEAREDHFRLFVPGPLTVELSSPNVEVTVLPGDRGTRWEQGTLATAVRALSPDVFFAPGYSAPLRVRAPLVLSMHDLSFVVHPEWFHWRERTRRRWLAQRSARQARLVLTATQSVRREIVERLQLPASRVRAIPYGIPRLVSTTSGPAPTPPGFVQAAGARDSDVPLVLFAGTIFNRRHLPDLIRAFAPLAARHPAARLEIVGANRTHPRQDLASLIAELGLPQAVRLRDYVPDDLLAALYSQAGAFVFLSEYEGFGFPPLEALASGVPLILADTPVAREVFGNAAAYTRIGNVAGVTHVLEQILFVPAARQRLLDRAPEVLARYSWTETARATLDALREAAG